MRGGSYPRDGGPHASLRRGASVEWLRNTNRSPLTKLTKNSQANKKVSLSVAKPCVRLSFLSRHSALSDSTLVSLSPASAPASARAANGDRPTATHRCFNEDMLARKFSSGRGGNNDLATGSTNVCPSPVKRTPSFFSRRRRPSAQQDASTEDLETQLKAPSQELLGDMSIAAAQIRSKDTSNAKIQLQASR